MFRPESKEEIAQRKEEARKTIYPVSPEYLECQIEDFYTPQLDFPTRPPWDHTFSKQELENREAKYFNVKPISTLRLILCIFLCDFVNHHRLRFFYAMQINLNPNLSILTGILEKN